MSTKRTRNGVVVAPAPRSTQVTPSLYGPDPLLTYPQAARAIGVGEFVLDGLVAARKLPRPIRHTEGGRRYFRQSAVIAYINSLEKRSKP